MSEETPAGQGENEEIVLLDEQEELKETEVPETDETGKDGDPDEQGEEGVQTPEEEVETEEQKAAKEAEAEKEKDNPVAQLRNSHKELKKKLREAERQNKELQEKLQGGPAKLEALPAKPTMESCEYDQERLDRENEAWYALKLKHDQKEADKKAEIEARQRRIQEVHQSHKEKAAALKVKDYVSFEDEVADVLSEDQQNIILWAAENSARVVVTLASNPKRLEKLASIKDAAKFAAAVGRLETEIDMARAGKSKPKPEKLLGSGGGSGGAQAGGVLAQLEAEADRTGDRTKVVAYRREQMEKQRRQA